MAINKHVFGRLFVIAYFFLLFFAVFGIRIWPIFYFRVSHGYNLDVFKHYTDLQNSHYGLNIFSKYDWWVNILLFIFFPICFKRVFSKLNLAKILIIGILTSVLIEFLQYVWDLGLADINDVIANSVGVIFGITFIITREIMLEKKRKKS